MVAVIPSRARQELARRELARRHYAHFLRYWLEWSGASKVSILWNWHIDYLGDLMEAVQKREVRRYIVNIPPRFLKSTILSQAWHAWMIGVDDSPRSSLFSAAATRRLAARDSRRTLGILLSGWYRQLFPHVQLVKSDPTEWATGGGAERNADGADGSITGRGGDHLAWDDLLLAKEANSETVREKKLDWLGETFRNRLNDPKTGTLGGIMQRLHERDPTGYLLEQMKIPGADQYLHVNLPCVAERRTVVRLPPQCTYNRDKIYAVRLPGDLLHPERIGPVEVAALKINMRRNWDGQFQQRPTKLEGGALKPALLQRVDKSPQQLVRELGLVPHIYLDLATKEKERDSDDPDFTVLEVWAEDQLNRKWLLHVWREQTTMDVVARQLFALYDAWKPRRIAGEKIGLQNVLRPMISTVGKLMRRAPIPIYDCLMSAQTDPISKVLPFEGALAAGVIYVPGAAAWLPDFEAEMRSWPRGAHDDMVVTAGYACHDLDRYVPGEAPAADPIQTGEPEQITGAMLRQQIELQRRRREEEGE